MMFPREKGRKDYAIVDVTRKFRLRRQGHFEKGCSKLVAEETAHVDRPKKS